MELWIRSQDKKRLTKVEDLYIVHDDNNLCDYIGNNLVGHLAKYTKKERALEVLDEIQQKIKTLLYLKPSCMMNLEDIKAGKAYFEDLNKQEFITCDTRFEIIPISTNTIVYEMPEE